MKIIDELLPTLDYQPAVRDIRQGPFQTAVLSRNCGLASTPHDSGHHHDSTPVTEAGSLTGRDIREVAALAKSASLHEAAIGMVLRESPWGRFYEQKKNEGHRFYKHATFHSYQDIKKLLTDSGFDVSRVVSTLFQKPGEVKQIEALREGYHDEAGFTLVIAGKSPQSSI